MPDVRWQSQETQEQSEKVAQTEEARELPKEEAL
jgi:hypothetical protein